MHAYIKMGHKNNNIYNYTVRKRKNEDINLKINKFQFVFFTYIYINYVDMKIKVDHYIFIE